MTDMYKALVHAIADETCAGTSCKYCRSLFMVDDCPLRFPKRFNELNNRNDRKKLLFELFEKINSRMETNYDMSEDDLADIISECIE